MASPTEILGILHLYFFRSQPRPHVELCSWKWGAGRGLGPCSGLLEELPRSLHQACVLVGPELGREGGHESAWVSAVDRLVGKTSSRSEKPKFSGKEGPWIPMLLK